MVPRVGSALVARLGDKVAALLMVSKVVAHPEPLEVISKVAASIIVVFKVVALLMVSKMVAQAILAGPS
eukprot:1160512-Pelagomonas_calceolata.AAC.9